MNESTSTNALAVAPANTALSIGLNIGSVSDLRAFAADIATSGIIGQITPTQAEVSLVAMRDEGITIVEFKRKYQWVGQELTVRPNWLLGEFKRRGGKYVIKRADRDVCDMTFTSADGSIVYDCKIAYQDMVDNGVAMGKNGVKDNWRKFPDDMLFARVCGKAMRRVAPELMGGVYTDGEAMDFNTPKPALQAAGVATASPLAPAADDYGVCPCGSVAGKAWSEIDTQTLQKILSTPVEKARAITPEHRNAIVEELGRREEAAQDEAVEPEICD